eukprot:GFYU01009360.1.p2 GENE.GFYU01009360.1~~GFYU01009360.1.p2  ORF type:complete len:128 (+),score=48.79 GFYU01009360.1:129-512(+)
MTAANDSTSSLPDGVLPPSQRPKGRPVSGRVWKQPAKRASATRTMSKHRPSLKEKQELVLKMKGIKEKEKALREETIEKKRARRKYLEEKKKKKEENELKSSQVQVIKNTAKIKKMSKKQLRMLQKR